jgi:ribosome-associated protein
VYAFSYLFQLKYERGKILKGESPLRNIKQRAVKAAELAIDKKARDTVILELKDLSSIADYFVICSGENPAQIKAIAEAIDEYFSKKKIFPIGREGLTFARWVLIDYGDIVIHIFNDETRAYYALEKFWMDAPRLEVDNK